jgi:Fe-S cluster assembly protein SufB
MSSSTINSQGFSGVSLENIVQFSQSRKEPKQILELRKKALEIFFTLDFPSWAPNIDECDIESLQWCVPSHLKNITSLQDLPDDVSCTLRSLGVSDGNTFSGSSLQYETNSLYHSLEKELQEKGVIFTSIEHAFFQYPELFFPYFETVVSCFEHKFSALHFAVFSGGSFLYVPEGVHLSKPVQSYFRMNSELSGQFEHTLIIAEKNSSLHYMEGCSAPEYKSPSLHAGCVEIIVKEGAKVQYSSIENWSKNTFNLNTKKARVEKGGHIEWVSANMGSKVSMLYPCSVLEGEKSSSSYMGFSFTGEGQVHDLGAKSIHRGKNTSSRIISKSLVQNGGESRFRSTIFIGENAEETSVQSVCDTLVSGNTSIAFAYPEFEMKRSDASLSHEASAGKLNEEDIFFLCARGFSFDEAEITLVQNFFRPVVKSFPVEYAVEINEGIEKSFFKKI